VKLATTRVLLFTGILIPTVFWISTIISANLHGNYNHLRDTISQLGAIGTQSENFMTLSTWGCVVLSVIFLMGLLNVCQQLNLNKVPLIGVLGYSIMLGWAATFHSGNPMHSKSGPVFLLLLSGPLVSTFLWKRKELKTLRILSFLSFVIMLFILLRVILPETIRDSYTGLIQRLVHFGWSIWFISLAFTFLKVMNKSSNSTVDN